VRAVDLQSGAETICEYDSLVLASGARYTYVEILILLQSREIIITNLTGLINLITFLDYKRSS
jgi:hypothetical protein